jgi:hypothetical protein
MIYLVSPPIIHVRSCEYVFVLGKEFLQLLYFSVPSVWPDKLWLCLLISSLGLGSVADPHRVVWPL